MLTTCITKPKLGLTLGQLINSELKKATDRKITEATREYPIAAMLTASVRCNDHTAIDVIEDYIKEELVNLEKYSMKPNFNKAYLHRELTRLSKLESGVDQLRRSKVETWLYIHECIKAFERENGLVGTILINIPLRCDNDKTALLDFVDGRAVLCQL